MDAIPSVFPCALCVLGDGPVERQLYHHANGDLNVRGGDISLNSTATLAGGRGAVERSAGGQINFDAGRAFHVPGNAPTATGTCTGCVPGTPTYAPTIKDPLAGLPQPPNCPPPGCPTGPAVTGPLSGTADPGVYTTIGGGAPLTLNPGTYIITGGMTVGSGITGTGVTLIFVCANYPTPCTPGGQTGATLVGGDLDLKISAPTGGQPYNGMAIMFDRNNCGPSCTATVGGPYAINLATNGGMLFTGTVYAPMASINLSGDGGYTINGGVIVRYFEYQSALAANLTYNPTQNIRSAPQGRGLTR
jgi:hypothetical protein